jgi:hypothetical protein
MPRGIPRDWFRIHIHSPSRTKSISNKTASGEAAGVDLLLLAILSTPSILLVWHRNGWDG